MGLAAGGINRSKKTPEEIAAEQAAADQDDFTSKSMFCYYRGVFCLDSYIQFFVIKQKSIFF